MCGNGKSGPVECGHFQWQAALHMALLRFGMNLALGVSYFC